MYVVATYMYMFMGSIDLKSHSRREEGKDIKLKLMSYRYLVHKYILLRSGIW